MSRFITPERISLRNHPEIKEDSIQEYIYQNPSILGLGDLSAIRREKTQTYGGRLDILFADENNMRYETEIQLGATDPSHIIRTIEYWDNEKKRYPQYDHCAVIVAEEITGRFMNVISLFNGAIPLIAIQMSAYKRGEDIELVFTKIIDRVDYGTDEDDQVEITDRKYWEKKSTIDTLKQVDAIYDDLKDLAPDYELKYNKFYIGLAKNGTARNFISFTPKKGFLYLKVKADESQEMLDKLSDAGLDVNFETKWKQFSIKLKDYKEYEKNREMIIELVQMAVDYLLK